MNQPFPAYRAAAPYVVVCYAHADAETVYPETAWSNEQGVNVWRAAITNIFARELRQLELLAETDPFLYRAPLTWIRVETAVRSRVERLRGRARGIQV